MVHKFSLQSRRVGCVRDVTLVFFESGLSPPSGFTNVGRRAVIAGDLVDNASLDVRRGWVLWFGNRISNCSVWLENSSNAKGPQSATERFGDSFDIGDAHYILISFPFTRLDILFHLVVDLVNKTLRVVTFL